MNARKTDTLSGSFKLGSHISCIYRTDQELFSLIIPFFIDGLNMRNKCLFIIDDLSTNEIINEFNKHNFDIRPFIKTKSFLILSSEDVYQENDPFNSEVIIPSLIGMETEALENGYTGLRIAGEAEWISNDMSAFEKLIKYEAKVNEFIEYSFITAACLYKESLYDSKSLIDLVINHPQVYLYNKMVNNKYFISQFGNTNNSYQNLSYEEIVYNLYQ